MYIISATIASERRRATNGEETGTQRRAYGLRAGGKGIGGGNMAH